MYVDVHNQLGWFPNMSLYDGISEALKEFSLTI